MRKSPQASRLDLVPSSQLRHVPRDGVEILTPVKLRPDTVGGRHRADAGSFVEGEGREVRRRRELARERRPAGAILPEVDTAAYRELMLKHSERRQPQIQHRRL